MWDILKDNWLLLLIGQYPHGPVGGLVATLGLAAISLALALPCGVLLALGRISPYRALRWPASAMVYLVRGLPLLMFIFWAYFFVPLIIGRPVAGTTTMVVALVCYESAYLAEIIRAGIQALPPGQQEAGRALGLSYLQTMRRVIPVSYTHLDVYKRQGLRRRGWPARRRHRARHPLGRCAAELGLS